MSEETTINKGQRPFSEEQPMNDPKVRAREVRARATG